MHPFVRSVCAAALASGVAAAAASPVASAAPPVSAGPFLDFAVSHRGFAPAPSADQIARIRRAARRAAAARRAQTGPSVEPAAVSYYAKTYEVSTATARARLEEQGRTTDLSTLLVAEPSSGYVDHWWDNTAGRLIVQIDPTGDRSMVERQLRAMNVPRANYEVERVSTDREALEHQFTKASEALARSSEGTAAVGFARGEVVVRLARSADLETRRRFREMRTTSETLSRRSAPPMRTVETADESLAITPERCVGTSDSGTTVRRCDQITAGQPFYNDKAGCTLAFYVGWKARSWFVPSMLTAGHCLSQAPLVSEQRVRNFTTRAQQGIDLSLQYFVGAGRGDVGMIDLYAHNWLINGGWWNWSRQTWTPSRSNWYFSSPPGVGYVVCKNGLTSGTTCGTVSVQNYSVGDKRNMTETTGMTTCNGDSGAPVTSASIEAAVGIHSGSYKSAGQTCGSRSFHSQIWEPMAVFNLDMYGGGPYGPYF